MIGDDGFPCAWSPATKREFLKHERELLEAFEAKSMQARELRALRQRVRALEAIVEALPSALGEVLGKTMKDRPGLSYGGVWDSERGYQKDTMITCSGSLWVATGPVQKAERPGRHPNWRLIAKQGSAAEGTIA